MSIEPTQADRDAAAAWAKAQSRHQQAANMRRGLCDNAPLVQAFARHRLSSTPASGEVVAWMYECGQIKHTMSKRAFMSFNGIPLEDWTETPLYAAPSQPAADLVAILHQYRSDMMHPPAPDSRERRIAMIDAALAKFGRDA